MTVFALPAYRGRHYRVFAAVPRAVTAQEAKAWARLGDALPREEARVAQGGGPVLDPGFRGARLGWLHPGPNTRALFERLGALAERANADFGFDLLGFAEPVQYTVYEAPTVGYDWHYDLVDEPNGLQRKLSLTIQLSDPKEYAGGDLELRDGARVVTAPRERGTLVAFPSWALHRVTPVTRGVRRSLVAWIGGPRFR
jgi:PKHD-type hydroxylase